MRLSPQLDLNPSDHADVFSGWLPGALDAAIKGKSDAAPDATPVKARGICKIASTVVEPDGSPEAVSGRLDSLPGCLPVHPATASTCASSPSAHVLDLTPSTMRSTASVPRKTGSASSAGRRVDYAAAVASERS